MLEKIWLTRKDIRHSLSVPLSIATGPEDHDPHCQKTWPKGKSSHAEDHSFQVLSSLGILRR